MKNRLKDFRSHTLNFLFIIAYVNIFQIIFGAENSIVGVIFTIMMSASMIRDLTATPLRHLIIQSGILLWMAIAACLVVILPTPLSFLTNFITLLVILYAFTYEYSSHMYFPYILSYLFLVFISPIGIDQLPKRMLGMFAGAISIILYQWVMGRNRVVETARDVLSKMIHLLKQSITYKLDGSGNQPDLSEMRHKLCLLSQIIYDRRRKILCVSDASFSMIDVGRGLENLLLLIQELPEQLSEQERSTLLHMDSHLDQFLAFLHQECKDIPSIDLLEFSNDKDKMETKKSQQFYKDLEYVRDRLLHMTDPQNKTHYRRTALSFKVRLQAALDLSPVRTIYAFRVALLLSCAVLLVQILDVPHGKWLLFTLASVSLPYADDVPLKMKKRFLATVIGGLIAVVIYVLIPSTTGRTAAMMLSGYASFYLSDYVGTFACSTIGALGGAVFMNVFGFRDVGAMFLIRLGYIIAGILIAYLINCLIFPYNRAKATRQLWEKYKTVSEQLTKVCHAKQIDPQLYYHLVIQAYLQEEKLSQNAALENWEDFPELLNKCKEMVRQAHRPFIENRKDAPIFEAVRSS